MSKPTNPKRLPLNQAIMDVLGKVIEILPRVQPEERPVLLDEVTGSLELLRPAIIRAIPRKKKSA